jgi:Methyltransferase domain
VGTPRVSIRRCGRCGHRVAEHQATVATGIDYHRQYEQGEFLDALAATRRRQAIEIWARLRTRIDPPDRLLDFGAGRGWLLDEARRSGARQVAGADTSAVAVADLRDRGIEALLIPPWPGRTGDRPFNSLSFRPRILALLDVIEHFPAARLPELFTKVVGDLRPELELVALKVPVADGILYRLARTLARARIFGPLEQLYQVGTDPPHLSYFTRRSLHAFLSARGLRVADRLGLVELDPASIGARVAALRGLPRPVTASLGAIAAWVAGHTWQDAYVALAVFDDGGRWSRAAERPERDDDHDEDGQRDEHAVRLRVPPQRELVHERRDDQKHERAEPEHDPRRPP